jgi:hypothetical protein
LRGAPWAIMVSGMATHSFPNPDVIDRANAICGEARARKLCGVPCCVSCGEPICEDAEDAAAEGVCEICFDRSQAAHQAELISEFRWASAEWLRCSACKGTGLDSADGENGFCFCHVGKVEETKHYAGGGYRRDGEGWARA